MYAAYKNNDQMRGGLGWVYATGMYRSIGRVKFPKFQTGINVEWKAPHVSTFLQVVVGGAQRETEKVLQ